MDDQWVFACHMSEMEEDDGIRIEMPGGGKKDGVALFLHGGKLFAVADRCCHNDKKIHSGDIEDLQDCVVNASGERGTGGVCVRCPKHQRKFGGGLYFNLETGEARTPKYTDKFGRLDQHHVDVYDVRVDGDRVYVSLRPRKPRTAKGSKRLRVSDENPVLDEKTILLEDPHYWSAKLHHVEQITHDSMVFTWLLPDAARKVPPPESSIWHVTLLAQVGSEKMQRDYTPISDWNEWKSSGLIRLLIKIYPNGSMTQHLDKLARGAHILMSSPVTTLVAPSFLPPGQEPNIETTLDRHLVLFAAGTGVVPMVQVVQEAMQSCKHVNSITLAYACKTLEDRLCWNEVQELERRRAATPSAPAFQIWLALSTGNGCLERHDPPLKGIAHQRLDAKVVSNILAEISTGEPLHVVCSGPDGFYSGMHDILQQSRFKVVAMVDLDA